MLIYRVEHKKHNNGPFTSQTGHKKSCGFNAWWQLIHDNTADYPTGYYDDIENRIGDTAYYGCPSIAAVKHWFEIALDVLDELGYVLRIFETDEFELGKSRKQVVFNRRNAVLVEEIPLMKVLEM